MRNIKNYKLLQQIHNTAYGDTYENTVNSIPRIHSFIKLVVNIVYVWGRGRLFLRRLTNVLVLRNSHYVTILSRRLTRNRKCKNVTYSRSKLSSTRSLPADSAKLIALAVFPWILGRGSGGCIHRHHYLMMRHLAILRVIVTPYLTLTSLICFCFLINFYWSIVDLQCLFLLYSKVNQLYIYIHPLFFRFFPHIGHYRVLIESPVLHSRFLVVICFTYSSVYMSIPVSQFIPPPLTPW